VIELAGAAARARPERVRIHRQGDVRAFAADGRSLSEVEPLTTDLAERIGAFLRRRPIVLGTRTRLGVQHRAQRREQRLARLGIEIAVDPHHPEQRDRRVQPPVRGEPILAHLAFDRLAPERRDALELAHRVDPRRLDELRLAPLERVHIGVPNRDQHANRRHRHVALAERTPSLRHPIQRPREPNVLARDAPRNLEPGDEPGRGREEAVALVQAPAIDLGEPAEPFDLELLDGAVQLGEVLLDPRVRQIRQRLGSQRVHDGT